MNGSPLRLGGGRALAGGPPAPGPARGERALIVAALAGHAVLLVALSLAWGTQPAREWPQPQPMEVSLVEDVALEATAPPSPEPPAPSVAPEEGAPAEAPPPAPAVVTKPEPVKPAPAAATATKPPPPAPSRAAPRPSRLAGLSQDLAAGAKADAAPARQRGRRLGDNFLAGLAPDAAATRASAAAPGKAGPYPTASIVAAIARQIQPCADRQVNPGPGANQIVTTLNLRLNPDGTLAATPRMVRQGGVDGENERYAQRVVDLGVAAFKGCTPLRLPADYYQAAGGGWSNINYQWKLR